MTNEELIIGLLTEMKAEINNVRAELNEVKTDVTGIRGSIIRIENEHGAKLNALFDGQKQNTQVLAKIAKDVDRHEEVIFRRVT